MKIAFFSSQSYDKQFFKEHNEKFQYELVFFEAALSLETVELTQGFDAVCVFVNDKVDAVVSKALASKGVKVVKMRGL